MGSFFNALWIIPILAVLIFLHELGHFVMARRAGVRVEEFGFGLPPRIWGVKRGDTIYSINWIPVGGFVRVLGEDGKSFAPDSMQSKTPRQRAGFLAAGSIMNFITAFLIIGALVGFQGRTSQNVYVVEVEPGAPAAEAGWERGDRFVEIDGREIDSDEDVRDETAEHAGKPMNVVLDRYGQTIETTVTPRENPPAGQGRTGITLNGSSVSRVTVTDVPEDSAAAAAGLREDDVIVRVDELDIHDYMSYDIYVRDHAGQTVSMVIERDDELLTVPVGVPATIAENSEPLGMDLIQNIQFERVGILDVPGETVRMFFRAIQGMADGLVSLITGRTPLDDIAGPIGMGQLTSEVIAESPLPMWVTLANLTFILSLNLGLLNLLPLPALDGGRLMFVLLEVLRRGKRVAPEKEGLVHFVGLVILLTLMFAIAFLDIDRLISGGSFLE